MRPFLHGILVALKDSFALQHFVAVVANSADFYWIACIHEDMRIGVD